LLEFAAPPFSLPSTRSSPVARTMTPSPHESTTVDDSGLAASEAVTYSFRNRIRLGDKKLHSDETICPLDESDGGEIVTLSALPGRTGESFTTADWLLLDGRGYESSDQAFEAGKRWRQVLSVAFARAGIAADFDTTLPDRGPNDRPESPEAPGLIVYPTSVRIEGFAPSDPVEPTLELFLSDYLPAVRESMPNGFESMPDVLKRRLKLAYSLVHLALSNANPDVQFILWITAVEALILDDKPERHDKKTVAALKALIRGIEDSDFLNRESFNSKVRRRVVGILTKEQEETITELGMKLARKLDKEYDGKSPDKFFQENYHARSRLVHGSIDEEKRLEPREIQRRLPHLKEFVMDLLEVEAASADDDDDDDDSGDACECTPTRLGGEV
jgi:hypothetical protein